jgi:hypothetical protein
MEKNRIRDKHPVSAILSVSITFVRYLGRLGLLAGHDGDLVGELDGSLQYGALLDGLKSGTILQTSST